MDPTNISTVVSSYFDGVGEFGVEDIGQHLYRLNLNYDERVSLPSIIDSNRLNQGSWYGRAKAVESHLSTDWGVPVEDLRSHMDLAMKALRRGETQRCNTSGTVFELALERVLRQKVRFNGGRLDSQVRGLTGGIRGGSPSITDLVLYDAVGDVVMVLSLKWSTRNDRTTAAAVEANDIRENYPGAKMVFVTNEFDEGRLKGALRKRDRDNKYSFNSVYHVSLAAFDAAYSYPMRPMVPPLNLWRDRFKGVDDLILDMQRICENG